MRLWRPPVVAAAPADPKPAQRGIAAELGRICQDPKVSVFALADRFGGLNGTVMVPTDHPVRPGDAIYVLERFF